jgi:acetoin utilization deacetylase AcuC-like enzyme
MKVIYPPGHRLHAPTTQFVDGSPGPYPEVPERVDRILDALSSHDGFEMLSPGPQPEEHLARVHDPGFLQFLRGAYEAWQVTHPFDNPGLIPDTFAVRQLHTRPANVLWQAGYYCFETQTPILSGTYEAAVRAAWCALAGAEALLKGDRCAYALCRPPGHHAGPDLYGGYCYLNNAAIAASMLADHGRVAILDIDFHHGNGTQQIFYEREDVTFLSIHADPDRKYPYFSGRADETGAGQGLGHNRNLPLGLGIDLDGYLAVLEDAMGGVRSGRPDFLVVSLGTDICEEDLLGDFCLPREGFREIGRRLSAIDLPNLFVQEGGYSLESMGDCVSGALCGFLEAE